MICALLELKDPNPSKIRNVEEKFDYYAIKCHKRCLEILGMENNMFDKTNMFGETPLFKAVANNSDKWIVELLIRKGANIWPKNNEGETVLFYALQKNNFIDIVKLLIESGAELHFKNKEKKVIDEMFNKLLAKPSILRIYQNALNKEFMAIFKDTDYEELKRE